MYSKTDDSCGSASPRQKEESHRLSPDSSCNPPAVAMRRAFNHSELRRKKNGNFAKCLGRASARRRRRQKRLQRSKSNTNRYSTSRKANSARELHVRTQLYKGRGASGRKNKFGQIKMWTALCNDHRDIDAGRQAAALRSGTAEGKRIPSKAAIICPKSATVLGIPTSTWSTYVTRQINDRTRFQEAGTDIPSSIRCNSVVDFRGAPLLGARHVFPGYRHWVRRTVMQFVYPDYKLSRLKVKNTNEVKGSSLRVSANLRVLSAHSR